MKVWLTASLALALLSGATLTAVAATDTWDGGGTIGFWSEDAN